MQAAQTAIDSFYMDTNQYPATLNDLLVAPSDTKISKKWQGPYWTKKNVPQDAWATDWFIKFLKEAHILMNFIHGDPMEKVVMCKGKYEY